MEKPREAKVLAEECGATELSVEELQRLQLVLDACPPPIERILASTSKVNPIVGILFAK